jgi:hexosaminidase
MKHFFIFLLAVSIACSREKAEKTINIIPEPESVQAKSGFFKIGKTLSVLSSNQSADKAVEIFSDELKDVLDVQKSGEEKTSLEINIVQGMDPESYSLEVDKKGILLSGSTPVGIFNGLQSLRQLILFSEKKNDKILIPCCSVKDSPRYGWRGIMLDESRHFFGSEKVKELLDMMALHKLNIFHWHLTDVPGWRLEIKKYPKLTTVGSIGNHNDPSAPAKFYTQDEIKDIVKYAADRFIQVVPEIDMPGHAGASNRAYPEFSGGGSEKYPEFTFNPGYEGTYSYLTDILKEVNQLFPSRYVHLGGDEVFFGNEQWNKNPGVKALMRKNKLADLTAVEKYFIKRMSDTINKMGKTTIGWDEIIDSGIEPDDAIIMWWRHDKQEQLKKALEKGYEVVLCPRIPLYFDFIQHDSHKYGRRWRKSFSDLQSVYSFPPDTLAGFREAGNKILGMQANLWTEVIHTNDRLDFMTYPRMSALAEAAWTKEKNYDDFLVRLKPMLSFMKQKGIYYFDPFNPELSPEVAGPMAK